MGKFEKLKKQILLIIRDKGLEEDAGHAVNTLKWLLKFNPKLSEEMKIAALAHDIERSIPPRIAKQKDESTDIYKKRHAIRSSIIILKLMKKHEYPQSSINKVVKLVLNHEDNYKADKNLRDADTVSFFDNNLKYYYKRKGFDKTKERIPYNLGNASKRAKKLIYNLKFSPKIKKLILTPLKDSAKKINMI